MKYLDLLNKILLILSLMAVSLQICIDLSHGQVVLLNVFGFTSICIILATVFVDTTKSRVIGFWAAIVLVIIITATSNNVAKYSMALSVLMLSILYFSLAWLFRLDMEEKWYWR